MSDEISKSALEDIEYIKKIMKKFDEIKPEPKYWFLWSGITIIAGILMQFVCSIIVPYTGFYFAYGLPWTILTPIGTIITIYMDSNHFKDFVKFRRDPAWKNKPSLFLLWVSMFLLASVLLQILIYIGGYDLTWSVWALVIGVGMIQTGNLFKSYYWSGTMWYLFGILMFIFGILSAIIIPLQAISPLLLHFIIASCSIGEGLRGGKQNRKRKE
ncbi:MAG: hypothetical protein ACFFAS_18905 [Promethearchaeota archaeon]